MKKTWNLIMTAGAGLLLLVMWSGWSLAAQPWETSAGRACIDSYAREVGNRLNSYNGSDEFNARKSWFINQWGVLNGNRRFGPTSTAAPDDFHRYRDKYHYMWFYWHVPNGYWKKPDWRAAGVPHIRPYVAACVRDSEATGSSTTIANRAASPTARDVVQNNERLAPNGKKDWAFRTRFDAVGTVIAVEIRNINGQHSVWDTVPGNGYWLTAVLVGEQRKYSKDGTVNFPIRGQTDFTFLVEDNGSLNGGRTGYKITLKFADGRKVSRIISRNGSRQAQTGQSRPGATNATNATGAIVGHRPPYHTKDIDIVGGNEILRGDNRMDWMFTIRLKVRGTVTGITVRNVDGQHSVWDTYPGNGFWLLGVMGYGNRVLNKKNGSVNIPVNGEVDLYLLAADNHPANGTLSAGKTRYKVEIKMADGQVFERIVGRGVSGGVTGSSHPNERCREYARTAVRRNRENIERECGFTGSRWSNDYNGHYNWCTKASKSSADYETRAREQGLDTCGGQKVDNVCEQYARTAVRRNKENIERRCGFTGSRWSNNYKGHYDWCAGVGRSSADYETRARAKMLRDCQGIKKNKVCEQYARTAVKQNKENIERRCGFTGSRWSDDYNGHYNWCTKASKSSVNSETRARQQSLEKCPGGGADDQTMEWNTNRPGQDYKSFTLSKADPSLCRDACNRESRCKAWTYVKPNKGQGPKPRCWLKHSVPGPREYDCCVSGVK